MNATNLVVLAVLAVILILAVRKIVRDKKRGVKCPGCDCGCSDSGSAGQDQCHPE